MWLAESEYRRRRRNNTRWHKAKADHEAHRLAVDERMTRECGPLWKQHRAYHLPAGMSRHEYTIWRPAQYAREEREIAAERARIAAEQDATPEL